MSLAVCVAGSGNGNQGRGCVVDRSGGYRRNSYIGKGVTIVVTVVDN